MCRVPVALQIATGDDGRNRGWTRCWYERLVSGEATSVRAIAREQGLNERYVGRILRTAFLAPDLVEAILHGRQPPEFTIERVLENLLLDWAQQREALGPI